MKRGSSIYQTTGGEMMQWTPEERRFLEKRKKIVRLWPYTGALMLTVLTALVIFLYTTAPLLIDPFETASRIRSEAVSDATLRVSALLLPIAFGTICLLLVALLWVMHLAFENEKRYFALLGEKGEC